MNVVTNQQHLVTSSENSDSSEGDFENTLQYSKIPRLQNETVSEEVGQLSNNSCADLANLSNFGLNEMHKPEIIASPVSECTANTFLNPSDVWVPKSYSICRKSN